MTIFLQREIKAPIGSVYDAVRDIALHQRAFPQIEPRLEAGPAHLLELEGDELTWSARWFGRRWQQTMRVSLSQAPYRHHQVCVRGPWRRFSHDWTLQVLRADLTLLSNSFTFESPGGPLGKLADRWLMRPRMEAALRQWFAAIAQQAETPPPH